MKLVRAIDPYGDADRDGVANVVEGRLGYDPLDPLSTPPSLTFNGPPTEVLPRVGFRNLTSGGVPLHQLPILVGLPGDEPEQMVTCSQASPVPLS